VRITKTSEARYLGLGMLKTVLGSGEAAEESRYLLVCHVSDGESVNLKCHVTFCKTEMNVNRHLRFLPKRHLNSHG
jgi:hypothetical protein